MSRLLYAATILYSLAVFIIFPKYLIDDGYIAFRYASNLANHGQLTWNVGEDPVEGFTNVALLVTLAAGVKLGLPLVPVSHAIGIGSFYLGLIFLFFSLRKFGVRELISSLIIFIYSTTPIFFTHVFSGLETMLFVAALLASFYFLLLALEPAKNRRLRESLFLLTLLFTSLVRPEGVALTAVFVLALGYHRYTTNRNEFWIFVRRFILIYFFPALIYFIWRVNYYGQLLPNTFYAKSIAGIGWGNLMDLGRFLRRFFVVPVIACLTLLITEFDFIWQKIKTRQLFLDSRAPIALLAALTFSAIIVFEVARTHLTMNYANRFYVPLIPFIWLWLGVAGELGWQAVAHFKNEKPLRHQLFLFFLAALFLYQASFHLVKLKEEIKFARNEKAMLANQHIAAGKFLKEVVPQNEWLAVYMDAGAIPYFSNLKTVDFGRINDEKLTRGNLALKEVVDYFYSYNPGAAVFTSISLDKLDYGAEAAAITSDPRFAQYQLVKKYPSPLVPSENYNEFVYLRKDLAARLP